jgi:hypothetical protein
VVLIGASNLGKCFGLFAQVGYKVVDLTIPGGVTSHGKHLWTAKKILLCNPNADTLLDFNFYGNSTFRFKQFDGTQALPYKDGRKYHLARNVVVSN